MDRYRGTKELTLHETGAFVRHKYVMMMMIAALGVSIFPTKDKNRIAVGLVLLDAPAVREMWRNGGYYLN